MLQREVLTVRVERLWHDTRSVSLVDRGRDKGSRAWLGGNGPAA